MRYYQYYLAGHEGLGDLVEDQGDCLFCVQQPDQSDRPGWLDQFDNQMCFPCLSIQECKNFDQNGCPAACLNYQSAIYFGKSHLKIQNTLKSLLQKQSILSKQDGIFMKND